MKTLTEFSAFIFDMDGLVLDTEPTYYAAWKAAVSQMGFPTEGYSFSQLSGQQYQVVEAQITAWYGDSFNLATFRQLGKKLWRDHIKSYGISIKPGVVEMLDFADSLQIPYCLATNSYRINAEECLRVSGIKRRFPIIISGDEVARPKPAPDIFLKAAAQLQVTIADCLVFEDSPAGTIAAVAAGATCVYVPSVLPADPYSLTIVDFKADNLLQVLQSLSSPC
jgi:beta-phosphoglucomutase